jgi:hypothetical protein
MNVFIKSLRHNIRYLIIICFIQMHQVLLTSFESMGYQSNSLFSFNRIKSHLDLIIKQNSNQAITSFDYDLA